MNQQEKQPTKTVSTQLSGSGLLQFRTLAAQMLIEEKSQPKINAAILQAALGVTAYIVKEVYGDDNFAPASADEIITDFLSMNQEKIEKAVEAALVQIKAKQGNTEAGFAD